MANDHCRSAGVGEHLGADIAGEGSGWQGVAILAANCDATGGRRGGGRDEGERRANQNIARRRLVHDAARDAGDLLQAKRSTPFIFQFPAISGRISSARLPLLCPMARPYHPPLFADHRYRCHASADAPPFQVLDFLDISGAAGAQLWHLGHRRHFSRQCAIQALRRWADEKIPIEEFQRDYRNFLRNAGTGRGHVITSPKKRTPRDSTGRRYKP